MGGWGRCLLWRVIRKLGGWFRLLGSYRYNREISKILTNKRGRLLKKYFLKNDVVTYLVEIYNDDAPSDIYLLKPKTRSITFINGIYPIASLMYYDDPLEFQKEHETLSYKELKRIEYVYVKWKKEPQIHLIE